LYLAEKIVFGKTKYYIRESYKKDDCYSSRDLFCLGQFPQKYIIYPGGRSFYIDSTIEEALLRQGKKPSVDELEDVFWPFLDPVIRRSVEPFKSRGRRSSTVKYLSRQQKQRLHADTHIFDKRRLLYLRFGQRALGCESRTPIGLIKKLTQKSRDEIEQYFIQEEKFLKPIERKIYVYGIFDIQGFFREFTAKKQPQSLDQTQVDQYFIEELCCLNASSDFFKPDSPPHSLHEHLQRYVVMFFDHEYGPSTLLRDYIQDFINRHRVYTPPPPKVDMDAASGIFGIKKEILTAMTTDGLTKLYRRRAQKLHPDVGGDHEQFIQLQQAYQQLLMKKKAESAKKG
jgi:hypothetical protein